MTKKICLFLFFAIILVPFVHAQDSGAVLSVNEMEFGTDIVDRSLVGKGDNFSASLEKIYCYTEVSNPGEPVQISHVWYYNDQKVGEVYLNIGTSSAWRTWSSKKILKSWTGQWKVEVLSPSGEVLKSKDFIVGTGPEYEMTEY
ncbi:MAG: DUF2914 domain-containing protein [Thermodesulfobacteriota bacterium]